MQVARDKRDVLFVFQAFSMKRAAELETHRFHEDCRAFVHRKAEADETLPKKKSTWKRRSP